MQSVRLPYDSLRPVRRKVVRPVSTLVDSHGHQYETSIRKKLICNLKPLIRSAKHIHHEVDSNFIEIYEDIISSDEELEDNDRAEEEVEGEQDTALFDSFQFEEHLDNSSEKFNYPVNESFLEGSVDDSKPKFSLDITRETNNNTIYGPNDENTYVNIDHAKTEISTSTPPLKSLTKPPIDTLIVNLGRLVDRLRKKNFIYQPKTTETPTSSFNEGFHETVYYDKFNRAIISTYPQGCPCSGFQDVDLLKRLKDNKPIFSSPLATVYQETNEPERQGGDLEWDDDDEDKDIIDLLVERFIT